MKTPADFPMLWTECFSQNNLNGLYGTKCFENKTERFGDGTKHFEKETKRFHNRTKRFENGTLLRCSSALQGLYSTHTWMKQNQIYKYASKIDLQSICIMIVNASLNILNIFLLFPYCLPLEKDMALHLNKLESPPTTVALCPVWWILAQWFWRRRWKCEKFTDRQTVRWTTGDQKSSLELSAQVSYKTLSCKTLMLSLLKTMQKGEKLIHFVINVIF